MLVVGVALAGVVVDTLMVLPAIKESLTKASVEPIFIKWFGAGGYELLGFLIFPFMGFVLFNSSMKKNEA